MVVFYLADGRASEYNAMKSLCNGAGVLSQCINVAKFSAHKKPEILLQNIVKQIINKYGELCWKTEISEGAPSLKGKNVMLLGVDVYHAAKKFDEGNEIYRQRRSVAALIAVIVDSTGRYVTSCQHVANEARRELLSTGSEEGSSDAGSDSSGENLEVPAVSANNALYKFVQRVRESHKIFPDVVVVYRDGVSEGELEKVFKEEVSQIQSALPKAHLIYTVVQKRIHTRFIIPTANGNLNPPPGTLINTLTSINNYSEFFLIPTRCNLSTVKPVRYIVLNHDESKVPLQHLQQLTYAMCHLYPNWTDSIKLPIVTQCAHKMAYLLGELNEKDPKVADTLFNTYFYL